MPEEEQIKIEEARDEIVYEDDLDEKTSQGHKGTIALIVIIIIAAVLIFNWSNFFSDDEKSGIVALVNGYAIYQSDIDSKYDQLPEFYQSLVDKEIILNQTINEILLKQAIKKEGISVTEEEVNTAFSDLLTRNMMSNEQFEEYLKTNSLNKKDIIEQIRDSLLLQKFLNQTLLKDVKITESDLLDYYENNKEMFTTLESRNVSQILICFEGKLQCEQSRTKEEATALINEIIAKSKTTSFDQLAMEYSDGPSSVNGGNLGIMDANTAFVAEFKDAALELKEGEISGVVETDYGFHLIKINNIIPKKTLSFEEVKDEVRNDVFNSIATQKLSEYIDQLKAVADIQIVSDCNVDGLIFYTADWCTYCQETEDAVDELINEGQNIIKVNVSDNDLVKTCYSKTMKDEIPQFICGKESVVGKLSKSEIEELAVKCS